MTKGYAIRASNGLFVYGDEDLQYGLSRRKWATWSNKKAAEKALTQVKKFYSKDLTYTVEAL